MEASVARRLRTPPKGANLQGLNSSASAALRSEGHRSIVVVGNYRFDPITAVSCRAKEHPLQSPVEPISPPPKPAAIKLSGLGWRRRVPPPGPKDLFRCPFIAIAALADGKANISELSPLGKGSEKAPRRLPLVSGFRRRHGDGKLPQAGRAFARPSGKPTSSVVLGWPAERRRRATPPFWRPPANLCGRPDCISRSPACRVRDACGGSSSTGEPADGLAI